MLDFLRNLGKSKEEKRQEALTAYLDNALTRSERERFERLLDSDERLRRDLEEQRLIRATLRRLPRVPAPRNFTLDPALYGRPVPSTSERLYPVLRAATAIVAILFAIVLVLDFLPFGMAGQEADQAVAESTEAQMEAVEAPAEEAPLAAEAPMEEEAESEEAVLEQPAIEVTRVVEEAVEMAAEVAEEVVVEETEPPSPEDATGGGAPAGEAPAEEGEGLAAEPVTVTTEEALVRPQATAGADRQAEALPGTAVAMEATEVSQPKPSPAARVFLPDVADEASKSDEPAFETPSPRAGAGPSFRQILAIFLGIGLIIMVMTTLVLRRRVR